MDGSPPGSPILGILQARTLEWVELSHAHLIRLSVAALVLGEGNGTPLQYSCMENPMDRGAW